MPVAALRDRRPEGDTTYLETKAGRDVAAGLRPSGVSRRSHAPRLPNDYGPMVRLIVRVLDAPRRSVAVTRTV